MISELQNKGLLLVDNPYLIKRYNQSLKIICDFETSLDRFHIDCSGYSPEIAEEIGNDHYLNPNGTNKRFILISIKQESLPILQSYYSFTARIIKSYIRHNRSEIMALTALDSVYGEIQNNVLKVESIEDLLRLREFVITIETPKKLIEKENDLLSEIERLKGADSLEWLKDENFEKLLCVSKEVGDISKTKLTPNLKKTRYDSFHTKHLGGAFVIRDARSESDDEVYLIGHPLIIDSNGRYPNDLLIDINDQERLILFLITKGLIKKTPDVNNKAIEHTFYNMAFEELYSIDNSVWDEDFSFFEVEKLIKDNHDSISENLISLYEVVSAVRHGFQVTSDQSQFLSKLFIEPLEDSWSDDAKHVAENVGMLINPYNYKELFEKNRPLFFEKFIEWPKEKQKFVEKMVMKALN